MIDILNKKMPINFVNFIINYIQNVINFVLRKSIHTTEQISIGKGTYGYNYNTFKLWEKNEKIVIGKYCSIAENVTIFGGGLHFYDRVTTYPFKKIDSNYSGKDRYSNGETLIKNDVWLGYGAIILSGVTIGNGAIIAAGSIVAKDVPDYAIVAGNPAKIINYRFNEETIKGLLQIQWWDWSDEKILRNFMHFVNPEELLKNMEKIV